MEQSDIKLYVCTDGAWNLAQQYSAADQDLAVGDAKLNLRSAQVAGVKVVHSHGTGQQMVHDTLYRVVKAGKKVPTDPDPAQAPEKPVKAPPAAAAPARPTGGKSARPVAAAAPPPPRPQPVVAKAPAKRRRKLSTAQRLSMAGVSGGIAGLAGPVLLSSNIAADVLAGGSGGFLVYGTAAAIFLAAFGSVFYATSQIGRDKSAKKDEAVAASGETLAHDPSMSLDEVMRLAAIEAEPFAIQPVDISADEPVPPPSEVQQIKLRLLQFLQDCLSSDAARKHLPGGELDARNRFGFHLFMLGAGQACAATLPKALKPRLADLVDQALLALGSDAEKARSFADGIAGYQKEVKNAAMIRAGYEEMSDYLKKNALTGKALARAMQIWNAADGDGAVASDPASQDVVIMFTDMVSSVETTQQIGDEGMMKLVDQHNLIVGAVLRTMRGHQVKHTGDGVMAVFPKVIDGLAAAAEIQRQIADFNSVTQGAALKVRIGLSAGNPIRKDDDYFGTVVQTAARVCPVATTGEIALPDAVSRLPGCERFAYSEPFSVPLKGFSEPQLVRKLLWGGGAVAPRPVPAPPPAETPAAPAPSADASAGEMTAAG